MISEEKLKELLNCLLVWAEEVDEDDCEVMYRLLEEHVDHLLCCDFFGTEGQNDPRGDRRE